MSMICICGVCIPYTALWPIVLLFMRQIYTYFYPDQKDKVKGKADAAGDGTCCSKTKASKFTCDGDVCVLNDDVDAEVEVEVRNGDESVSSSPLTTSEQTYVKPSLPVNYKKDMNWDDVIAEDKTLIFRFTENLDPFYDQVSLENNNADVVFYNVYVDEHDEVAALGYHVALTILLFVSYYEQLGSTHGRPIVSLTTLSGEVAATPDMDVLGITEVRDFDGSTVHVGGKLAPRTTRAEQLPVPPINREVKPHWHKVVLHQGWLLKQGGIGVGASKSWIKRYFVLYKTSQGHFLTYYADFTECPLYSTEKNHRNFIDLAKCCFIRPGSNKQDNPDTPAHCFDIVTVEREWTLCAENADNEQQWLKLLTKAVDEDVAILPDEEVVFKVKPKVDPLGILPSNDYSTSLKVSAHGISVTTPVMGKEGQELEHYFWVYTDFYKWTLLSQAGKLALLVNVFADATFNRRIEYIFRNKDALRLATAIEFFIEKFMCWMHIRLELMDSTLIAAAVSTGGAAGGRLHTLNAEDVAQESQAQYAQELNLLDFDMDELNVEDTSAPAPVKLAFDPFGDAFLAPPAAPVAAPAPAPVVAPVAEDDFAPSVQAPVIPPPPAEHNDPFAELLAPAAVAPELAPASAAPVRDVKDAAPLTAAQTTQHRLWLIGALSANGGPLYDDGTLQVASKIETRGSQCRFSFMHINHSSEPITEFKVTVTDPAGLMRFELGELPTSELEGGARLTQIMMAECQHAVAEAPQVTFTYVDATAHRRTATIDLPLIVTSFNEPHALSTEDFSSRWQQLVGAGQEAQEVLKPSYPVVPTQVYGVLTSMLKFARVEGLPDATEFVVYGAATLRTGVLGEDGEKVGIDCLVKIEMNVQANAMRVTLRSVQPAAAQAILKTVKSLLL